MTATVRGRLWTCALASIALIVLATACSAPRYEYVRNTSLRTAFKVPRDWELFDRETLLGLPPGPTAVDARTRSDGSSASTATRDPSVAHILDPSTLNTDHPQGVALVQRFSFDDRDTSSFNALRNYLFPVDALIQDPNSGQVLSYDDSNRQGRRPRGAHRLPVPRELAGVGAGERGRRRASGADDLQRTLLGGVHAALLSPDYVTVDQMAYVNADSSQVYIMAVLCSAACYQRNDSDISSIVDSWTVLP